jgi:hypothetical protein
MNATKTNERQARINDVAETMVAAENVRCACGDHGSWEHTISGTSGPGNTPCVWAGCPNCTGRAVGIPVLLSDLRYARRQPAELDAARQYAAAKLAAERHGAGYTSLGDPCRLGDGRRHYDGSFAFPILTAAGTHLGNLYVDSDGKVTRGTHV